MKVLIHSCADISEVFLNACKKVSETKDLNVVGVYSRSLQKAENYKSKHKLLFATDDYEKILASDSFDTVYICSPNSLHKKHALSALKARKNVIIEKPIALSISDIEELYNEARKNNVYVFDALLSIYTNNIKSLKEFIKDEEVELIDFHFSKQTRHYQDYKDGKYFNVFDKKMGGGAINDLGVYLIYPLLYLFGFDYQVVKTSKFNKLDADLTSCFSGKINNSLFTLRTSKIVFDKRPSVICTTNYYIEIAAIGLFTDIKIFNSNNELVKVLQSNEVKMFEEVSYFTDVVNNKVDYDQNLEVLAKEVRKFIEK